MTTALLARAAALLEAAEAMIGLLRDHTEELARGEAPHVFTALDAYVDLQEAAQALRLHFDSPNTDDVSAFDALVAMHAHLLEANPYCYFEVAYTRYTGWMAWICTNSREKDPNRKVLASGQGETTEEACENALDQLTAKGATIPESEIPY